MDHTQCESAMQCCCKNKSIILDCINRSIRYRIWEVMVLLCFWNLLDLVCSSGIHILRKMCTSFREARDGPQPNGKGFGSKLYEERLTKLGSF